MKIVKKIFPLCLVLVVNIVFTISATADEVDVRNYASFSAAIDTIGATVATLLIPNQQNVTADKTVPSNISLKFLQGGSLNISNGVTVTINGAPEAGLYQIFLCAGTGKVRFASAKTPVLYPQWFGAAVDGSTNDITALNMTIACLQESGGGELLITGLIKISSKLSFIGAITNLPALSANYYGKIKLRGIGSNTGIISDISSGNVIQLGDATNDMGFKLELQDLVLDGGCNNVVIIHGGVSPGCHNVCFSNLLIKGFNGADSAGIDTGRITDSILNTIVVQGQGTGKGIITRRSTAQLIDCRIFYAHDGVWIANQAEASIQMIGGGILVCQNCITFEGTGSSRNANFLTGVFLGENRDTCKIVNVANTQAGGVYISSLTFQGCLFNSEGTVPLLDFSTLNGTINLIGNVVWNSSANFQVLNGINSQLIMIGNSGLTIHPNSYKNLINKQFKDSDLSGSLAWDPPSISNGSGSTSSSITVSGAAFGDPVLVAAPYNLQGLTVTGYVSATDTVVIRIHNGTGVAVNLVSGTWNVKVIKY